ncbi:hypothetical protein T10_1919 [Trichinella papuae]|uniref:Uncharacterized protein n=1 Tax=Trichinella papuae TaxID=268474 RepID=A0A0V1M836_9BILA|nr:hypothetical protein T10_1919 [Trichinella papuae]
MSNFYEYLPLLFMPYNPTQGIYITDRISRICMLNFYPLARSGWTVWRIFFKKQYYHKKYCDYSSSFRHYVFTQILRCSHAVLDCASMKAFSSVWNPGTGAAIDQPPVRSASFSRYHYCYGVEPHKRKQPCTEPADPKHTCTLRSKGRIYIFGGFEIREC